MDSIRLTCLTLHGTFNGSYSKILSPTLDKFELVTPKVSW